jgi:hypothetical protein
MDPRLWIFANVAPVSYRLATCQGQPGQYQNDLSHKSPKVF